MEFPHLMQLVDNNQFDTIYHEHFSYLSFHTVKQIFESQGLELFDVEEIPHMVVRYEFMRSIKKIVQKAISEQCK